MKPPLPANLEMIRCTWGAGCRRWSGPQASKRVHQHCQMDNGYIQWILVFWPSSDDHPQMTITHLGQPFSGLTNAAPPPCFRDQIGYDAICLYLHPQGQLEWLLKNPDDLKQSRGQLWHLKTTTSVLSVEFQGPFSYCSFFSNTSKIQVQDQVLCPIVYKVRADENGKKKS